MRAPLSRLLLRFNADIEAASSPVRADCLRAERAGYLARLGRFDEVRAELAALHQRYDPRPQAAISVWLNLVEGLLIHASNMGEGARDKISRAYALSAATGGLALRALSAAWLAHLDFLQARVSPMASHLTEALSLAEPEHHAARARATLVVAQGFHQAGRFDLALPWYASAKQHANAEGDDATVSALMHNMAWLKASNLRQDELLGTVSASENERALMSAQSTAHYDILVGSASLQAHVPMLRAKLLISNREPAAALALLEKYLPTALLEGMARLKADLLADQAWCRLQVGQNEGAKQDAWAAQASLNPEGLLDDRAFAHSRLAEVFAALEEPGAAAQHQQWAAVAWRGHTIFQGQMLAALTQLPHVA
jgi:hypothetical protein